MGWNEKCPQGTLCLLFSKLTFVQILQRPQEHHDTSMSLIENCILNEYYNPWNELKSTYTDQTYFVYYYTE